MALKVQGRFAKSAYHFASAVEATALVTVTALERPDNANKRPSMDIVCVLDTSGSMSGTKLQLCSDTLEFLARELSEGDQFGLVTFSNDAKEVIRPRRMDEGGKAVVQHCLESLVSDGGTNLSDGFLRGIESIKSCGKQTSSSAPRSAAILLLTDGEANQGVTDVTSFSRLATNALQEMPNVKVFTFGYGASHNENMLSSLAEIGRGSYRFVENTDDVATAFADVLGGLTSVSAQAIKISLSGVGGAKIAGAPLSKFPCKPIESSWQIDVPDMYEGESRNILVRAILPALTGAVEGLDDAPALQVKVEFIDISSCSSSFAEATVCVSRPSDMAKCLAIVEDPMVVQQSLRYETIDIIASASLDAEKGNLEEARKNLRNWKQHVETKKAQLNIGGADGAEITNLTRDLENLEANLASEHKYKSTGAKKMKLSSKEYAEERCYRQEVQEVGGYRTKTQSKMSSIAADLLQRKAAQRATPVPPPSATPVPPPSAPAAFEQQPHPFTSAPNVLQYFKNAIRR